MKIDSDKLETKELDELEKILKKYKVSIKVGILGDGDNREDEASNATVGLVHEFGGVNHPERSFLRMPLSGFFYKRLESSGLFKDEFKEIIKEKGLESFANKIAQVAVETVKGAFHTGGYGKWKPSNMDYKENHQTLVESQQLRNSITSEVKIND